MAATMNRNAPRGPRGGRGGYRGGRGQAQDQDEDVDMSAPQGPRGRNNNTGRGGFQQQGRSPAGRNPFNDQNLQRETLRRAAQQSFPQRQNENSGPQNSGFSQQQTNHNSSHRSNQGARSQQPVVFKQARVTGWLNSTASSDADGGAKALVSFIERRATKNKERHADLKGFKPGKPVEIADYQTSGDALLISFNQKDIVGILHVSGNRFAGVDITIEQVEDGTSMNTQATSSNQIYPNIPPSVSDLPQEKVAMVAEVSRLTNLNPTFARMCLEQGGWDWQKAGQLFDEAKAKGTLSADAYLNGVAPSLAQAQPVPEIPMVAAPVSQPVIPVAANAAPQQNQEAMIAHVSQLSGMTPEYSRLALEAAAWNLEQASTKFMEIKDTLPAEAWLQPRV